LTEFTPYNAGTNPIVTVAQYNALLDHGLEKPVSFIIRKNGIYYEAIQGGGATGTGTIVFGGSGNAGGIIGTNATSVLKACIATLTLGGKIFFKNATYTFPIGTPTFEVVDVTPNIEIEGESKAGTVFQLSGTVLAPLGFYFMEMGANTSLRNLTIDANGDNLTYTAYGASSWWGAVILGNFLLGSIDKPATNAVVENVRFINAETKGGVANLRCLGLNVLYGKGITVDNVIFTDCDVGLFITYQPGVTIPYLYKVHGVYGNGNEALIYWEIGGCQLSHVRGYSNTRDIYMVATAGSVTYGMISNFESYDATTASLQIAGAPAWLQINNFYSKDCGGRAVQLYGTTSTYTINNLVVEGAGERGVWIQDVLNFTWTSGKVSSCQREGIYISNSDGSLSAVRVYQNNQAAGGYSGIGVYGDPSDNEVVINACVIGSIIETQDNGIVIDNTRNTVVTGCRILGHDDVGEYGVLESGASDYTLLIGNNLRGNTTAHNVDAAGSVAEHNIS
jgi:hypothetical protein